MSRKTKQPDSCKCLEQVQEQLKESNAQVTQSLMMADWSKGTIRMSGPQLMLNKIDSKKRGRLPYILCAFCPFCGTKYPE